MNETIIIIVASVAVLALSYGFSMWLTRKQQKQSEVSADDWEIGGRELPLYVVVGTQFATAMGGGILVGQVGNGFNNGFSVMLYGLLCQLSFFILMFIAKWLRKHQFATVPEILLQFCGSLRLVLLQSDCLCQAVYLYHWYPHQRPHHRHGGALPALRAALRSKDGSLDRFYIWLPYGNNWLYSCPVYC